MIAHRTDLFRDQDATTAIADPIPIPLLIVNLTLSEPKPCENKICVNSSIVNVRNKFFILYNLEFSKLSIANLTEPFSANNALASS